MRIRKKAPYWVIAAAAMVGAGAVPGNALAAITPAAGVHIKAAHSNKCLNVQGGSLANSAAIIQFTCSDTYVNDNFRVRPVGTTGNYQIIAISSNKCLNVQGGLVANSTPVIQFGCVDTGLNNLWRFVPVAGKPTFRIVSVQSGKCLNVRGGGQENSAQLVIFTCTTPTTPTNDQFYFPPAASPVATPLATVDRTPVVGVQGGANAQVGPLVYAFTDNGGRMWRAYQADPEIFTVEYSPVPGLEQFAGHPQVNVQADGRVQVAARNTAEGDLWLTNQSAKQSSIFNAAQDVGGAGAQQPAIGKLPDGKLVTFAVVNGSMWHLPQDGVTMPYGAWRQVGGANLVGEPTVVTIRDGLRLFALTTAGVVQTATYRDGLLSDWTGLGAEQFTGRIAAAVLPGYRSRVVVRNAAGLLFTKGENVDGTFEANWTQIGDLAAAGSPAAVMDPATGATAVVARGSDGQVYYVSETAQATGVWGTWRVAFEKVVETDPTIITYTKTGGPAWGYLTRDVNNVPSLFELRRDAAARSTAKTAAKPAFVQHTLPAPPK
jgi:hypothetical protein